jgi:UPF0042 nucleotide-binding protein
MTDSTVVVVVTGLSGAGKSNALHALEDLGFFCIDNLPTALAPQAVEVCEAGGMRRIGLGIDVRVGAFLSSISKTLTLIGGAGARVLQVLFLDASDETLFHRFNETRRPHPLTAHEGGREGFAVLDGVRLERERLSPLRASATHIIDTTRLNVHELRRMVLERFGPDHEGLVRMATRIVSFGFKYGAPVDADLLIDVRFLNNPYFVSELRSQTGLDEAVANYVLDQPDAGLFIEKLLDLLQFAIPRYEREGKSYLTVAIGCTGGRHRSVAIAETLAPKLREHLQSPIAVAHRDMHRIAETMPPSSALGSAAVQSSPRRASGLPVVKP